ncbi:uncharacterized protein Z520_09808 [Fonsecaea multimorphosa CBS 102226]|uniref:Uncharacterized protein n=1 Tax=Fonsecaea multimorphosa CBS 102226 TaxID=1442371 RepID=A0A0D2JMA2_9EURO|nr:uncharacterized protein Z520_09808 [Fonsecaea multimorphosa CBS 102226]KIX94422.1 hypothetical protein Z520_09808 [Fonsecaea multimorphosa CBS 102226]OAL20003.1 hypothetical protein AYO22_09153 [Fonsecaea multimorphosa]
MDFFRSILECFGGADGDKLSPDYYTDTKEANNLHRQVHPPTAATDDDEKQLAASILSVLFTAEKPGRDLQDRLNDIVHTNGWYEGLAKRVLDGLIAALQAGKAMGGAIQEAYDKAYAIGRDFVREHPVLTAAILTVVAIGILVYLAPWAIEALGFGARGPVGGSFAAFWQSTFPDVETASWFAWFQRLGMTWGKV